MVLVRSHTDSQCTDAAGSPSTISTFLNDCQPVVTKEGKLWYHRKITYASGDGTSASLQLVVSKYAVTDKMCKAAVISTTAIVYPATSSASCLADPLLPGRYYSQAAYTTNLSVNTPAWLGLPPSSFAP